MTSADELRRHLDQGIITKREHDLLELYLRGLSQRRIALIHGISRSTARDLLNNAFRKIAAATRRPTA